jgi:amidase
MPRHSWWGYQSQWNLLDYPGVILPVGFVDKHRDLRCPSYTAANETDKENHELCMEFLSSQKWLAITDFTIDDPELWHGAPIAVQLVGRHFDEEGLLAVSVIVDEIVNGRR